MSQGEAAGDEVLLGLGTLVDNLQDSRLELSHDGNVIGRDAVLSGGARDDDLRHRRLAVDGLVGEVEVEGNRAGFGRGDRGEGPSGKGGEASAEGCLGKHGWNV